MASLRLGVGLPLGAVPAVVPPVFVDAASPSTFATWSVPAGSPSLSLLRPSSFTPARLLPGADALATCPGLWISRE
ncbi:hypothetical protein BN970_04891 [Mycolicibacterium conceptionense]|uniref:Uncharacterized protein n=1 Tax=Mycolicibacterium conceptionense TaxID=451644 RepID=A0A0U1DSK4_9MYCO|nr:hypothetical protein BN970_04891 [Mycolicibacterium conceptionense]